MPQFPGSVPSFASKVPKTPAGIAVSDESHRVPASAPFVINLNQAIKEGTTPSAVCVDPAGARTPVAEGVPVTPGTFSFQRASGTAQFHSSDANREITFAYTGIGSPVRSEDLNQITGEIVAIAQYVKQLAAQRAQVLTGHIFGVAEPTDEGDEWRKTIRAEAVAVRSLQITSAEVFDNSASTSIRVAKNRSGEAGTYIEATVAPGESQGLAVLGNLVFEANDQLLVFVEDAGDHQNIQFTLELEPPA